MELDKAEWRLEQVMKVELGREIMNRDEGEAGQSRVEVGAGDEANAKLLLEEGER